MTGLPAEKWACFLTNLKSKGGAEAEGNRLVGLSFYDGDDLLEAFFDNPREISVMIGLGYILDLFSS